MDCDVCDQTLVNARRDVEAVLRDTCELFEISDVPFLLRVRFEGDELVVTTVSRDLS